MLPPTPVSRRGFGFGEVVTPPPQTPNSSVLSHDGQGGVVLRDVAKLDELDKDTVATQHAAYPNVKPLSSAIAAVLVTCTRGEVTIPVRRVQGADPGKGRHC